MMCSVSLCSSKKKFGTKIKATAESVYSTALRT